MQLTGVKSHGLIFTVQIDYLVEVRYSVVSRVCVCVCVCVCITASYNTSIMSLNRYVVIP